MRGSTTAARALAALALLSVAIPRSVQGAFPPVRLDPVSVNEIVAPVGMANAGDGTNRLFVLDQRGKIHIIQNGALNPAPFLDLGAKLVPERANFDERGLLGLAFHPNFGQQGTPGADKFYVFYTATSPLANPDDPVNPINSRSTIAEYSVPSLGSNVADINSERILLSFDKPQFNHNGGNLAFGPDGMLYISTGDGGGSGDDDAGHTGGGAGSPKGGLGNSQDRTNLLGKILRIDVNGTANGQYTVPADNPFVGVGGGVKEEIYAYGFRNPWRVAFDDGPGGSGRLFVADVGQNIVEEIDIVEKGGNYGWHVKEGKSTFDGTAPINPAVPLIDPIAEYAHPGANVGLQEFGVSITGGEFYRGTQSPALQGKYLFGDFSTAFNPANGALLGMEETSPGVFALSQLSVVGGNPIGRYINAFGTDENGEVYVATKLTLGPSALLNGQPSGGIFRIVAVPEPGAAALALAAAVLWVGRARVRRARRVP